MVKGVHLPADPRELATARDFATIADLSEVGGEPQSVALPGLGYLLMPKGSHYDASRYPKQMYEREGRQVLPSGLEFNRRATSLLGLFNGEVRHRVMLGGDAAIIGPQVGEQIGSDLPPELIWLFTEPGEYWLETQLTEARRPRLIVPDPPYESYFDALRWALQIDAEQPMHQVRVFSHVAYGNGVVRWDALTK